METKLPHTRTATVRSIDCKRSPVDLRKAATIGEVPAQLGTLITLQLLLKQPILDVPAVFDTVRIDIGLTLQLWNEAAESGGGCQAGRGALYHRIVTLGRDSLMEIIERTPIIGIRQFGNRIGDAEALWRHSQATALAAEVIASLSADVDPSMAYLGGLLHELGTLRALLEQKSLRNPQELTSLGREWAIQYRLPAHVLRAIEYLSDEPDEWLPFRRLIRTAHEWASSTASLPDQQDLLQNTFQGVNYSTVPALPCIEPENRRALLKSLCALLPACTV